MSAGDSDSDENNPWRKYWPEGMSAREYIRQSLELAAQNAGARLPDTFSAEELDYWLRPRQAIAFLNGLSPSTSTIKNAINERAMSGHLRVAAVEIIEKRRETLKLHIIDPDLWKRAEPSYNHPFWERGDVQFTIDHYSHAHRRELSLIGVRFDPVGLQSIRDHAGLGEPKVAAEPPSPESTPDPAAAPAPAKPHPGGPKRKPYWDDLWIEVIRRIPTGSLKTETASELEEILCDIVETLGHRRPGDSTLKPMSLKLLKYLEEERG